MFTFNHLYFIGFNKDSKELWKRLTNAEIIITRQNCSFFCYRNYGDKKWKIIRHNNWKIIGKTEQLIKSHEAQKIWHVKQVNQCIFQLIK